jgi:hypothetical protein
MWNDNPDGYPIPAWNPMGTGTNFYPRVRVRISTHSLFADGRVIALPDPLPSLSSGPAVVAAPRAAEHTPPWAAVSSLWMGTVSRSPEIREFGPDPEK